MTEAQAIVTHARQEAERIAAQAARDLDQSLARRQRLAEERIAQAEARATAEVRAAAVDTAIAAAREVIASRDRSTPRRRADRLGDRRPAAAVALSAVALLRRIWRRGRRSFVPTAPASIRPPLSCALVLALYVAAAPSVRAEIDMLPGMPPVVDPQNLYSETGADHVSPEAANDLPRVYVPSLRADRVYVIDPERREVIDSFPVGKSRNHIVPSWDLKTLWVTNAGLRGTEGSLTPIDPKTGKPGPPVPVADPYNLYFTPDGKSAIVVAERLKRLDFRDPQTMAPQYSIADAGMRRHQPRRFLDRRQIRDLHLRIQRRPGQDRHRRTARCSADLKLSQGGMPQDIRISPDGKVFYVADMMAERRVRRRRRHVRRDRLHPDRHRARTGSTRAATAPSSTSPTAGRSTATAWGRAACR